MKEKFDDKGFKETSPNVTPPNLTISKNTMERIARKINTKKAYGNDMIPLYILSYEEGRELVRKAIEEASGMTTPPERMFNARLQLFNKRKDGKPPHLNEIRGIAITGVMQKVIEQIIKERIEPQILPKLNPA